MAANKLKLTRNQFREFLKDHESIKQFEQLFDTVDAIAPDFVNEVYIAAGIAEAKATQALASIERLRRNQEVLTWLSMQ